MSSTTKTPKNTNIKPIKLPAAVTALVKHRMRDLRSYLTHGRLDAQLNSEVETERLSTRRSVRESVSEYIELATFIGDAVPADVTAAGRNAAS
jgi:hypothetical protein